MPLAVGSFLGRVGQLLRESLWPEGDAWNLWSEPRIGSADEQQIESNEVAERLLKEVLGAAHAELVQQGYIDVLSSLSGNTVYRLRIREPIEVYKNGRREAGRLCVVARERVPAADELLVKVLWLRTSEAEFLAIGNRIR